MMMQRTLLVFLLASAWTTVVVTGFVATKGQTNALAFGGVGVAVSTTQRSPRLWMVGYTASSETEDQARYVLSRAKECAYCSNDEDENDECCSIEECESLLHEMIRLQSRCVTGTLIGQDLCDDQDVVADVVAHLRHKVKTQKQQAIERADAMVPWIATELSLGAMMLVVAVFWTTLDMTYRHDVVPPQSFHEWWCAMRDGHIDSMIEHYLLPLQLLFQQPQQ